MGYAPNKHHRSFIVVQGRTCLFWGNGRGGSRTAPTVRTAPTTMRTAHDAHHPYSVEKTRNL
jgi:hypothetical protein